ncbi:MAG: hypothetical protein JJT82_09125 [Legionellaceae bacterium]|nr:hypothetical protein [Legionellaceae bacterium]
MIRKLADLNQDLRYQLEQVETVAAFPAVRFFKRGQSPISEAGGHRKQVLIFQQGVNLDAGYVFPDETKCTVAQLEGMPDHILSAAPSLT